MSILQGNPEYAKVGVEKPPKSPLPLLREWIDQAARLNVPDHQALVLGTVQPDGRPRARVVSAKSCDHEGIIFGTSKRSGKGGDFAHSAHASGVFWWPLLVQQVTIMGSIEALPPEDSDALFAGRTRDAQAVATVSHQSHLLVDEQELCGRVRNLVNSPGTLSRPEHWCGFRLVIESIEFWHGRADRMHRRLCYERGPSDWRMCRLQP